MVTAEITSEDRRHPIECALLEQDEDGWRAGEPGVSSCAFFSTSRRTYVA